MRSNKKIESIWPKSLSMILPAFNEQDRIDKTIEECKKIHQDHPKWEFIFVNDGSTDKTYKKLISAVNKNASWQLISYPTNQGKGFALKQGVKTAKKDYVLLTDIDFSTPINQLKLMRPFIKSGADMVISSRKVAGAKILKHQDRLREFLGQMFTNLSKLWLSLKETDVTCGFKLMTKKTAKLIFKKSRIKGWGYDAEILFLAKKYDFKVVDVAVTWQNDERSKVSVLKDIFKSLSELVMIRVNDWIGKY